MAFPTKDEVTSCPQDSTALVITGADNSPLNAQASDLELHLIQTLVAYTSQHVLHSYQSIKHAFRVTHFIADRTERLVSRLGLVTLVQLLFHQYRRLGHPLVQQMDEAMGKRVIDAVVRILMLTEQTPEHHEPTGRLALEADPCSGMDNTDTLERSSVTKLSYTERFQALLLGEVPRMEQALAQVRLQTLEEAARQDPPPVVMELKDFVPVDEVTRLKVENKEKLHEAMLEATRLRTEMMELTQEKQRLEQQLTDVHNYQESERGRRFQNMEEDLARTKLEATQKAYDARKLALVVEDLQRKHKHKKKNKNKNRKDDTQSNTSESAPPSSIEGKRSRQTSNVTT